MKKFISRILFILMVSIAIEAVCLFLQSKYLVTFLTGKIVEIEITLIAINTATSSFIVSKLQELSRVYNKNFTAVYNEIKLSLYEQIALVIFSISCLTVKESQILQPFFIANTNTKYIYAVLIIFSFLASLDILRDTGSAMFSVLLESDKKKNTLSQ